MLGYITRAKMTDKAFSSLRGYFVVPDEENKKLIITEAIGEGEEKFFICHRCTDLTTFNNAKNINFDEMKLLGCNHSKLSQILFGDLEGQTKLDKEKNLIDVVKDGTETIAIVFPSQDQARRPGVIHLTSRTKRPRCDISTNIVIYQQILSYVYKYCHISMFRCVTCSGQKCLHVNIYVEEAKQRRETDNMRERQKEKNQSKNRETTEVVGDTQLPFEPTEKGDGTHNSQNELNMFQFKGKSSNVFKICINYPPNEDEKEEIKRINTEDIFPENIAAPNIEEDEQCQHGNKFSPKLTPANIESRNMIIHHTTGAKDSRNSSLHLMFLRTEGGVCPCKKYFTGESKHLLRVSPVEEKSSRDCRPVHFVSYYYLFQYHQTLMSGGISQNAFADTGKKLNTMLHQGQSVDKRILKKAYEIFIHALKYDIEKAWGCPQCPKLLGKDEHESMFNDVVEVHIADGINMGTTAALKELEAKELFTEDRVKGPKVKGIEAKERTFLAFQSERLMIESLSKSLVGVDDMKKLGAAWKRISNLKKKSENMRLIENLLRRLKDVPNPLSAGYQLLLEELWKCTPISQLLPSNSKEQLKQLETYLTGDSTCFESFQSSKTMTEAFPFPVRILQLIQKEENGIPDDVQGIFQAMINLKRDYTALARERAMVRKKPKAGHKEAESEVYPNYPIHTMEYEYEADSKKDDDDEDTGCNKDYNESATTTCIEKSQELFINKQTNKITNPKSVPPVLPI